MYFQSNASSYLLLLTLIIVTSSLNLTSVATGSLTHNNSSYSQTLLIDNSDTSAKYLVLSYTPTSLGSAFTPSYMEVTNGTTVPLFKAQQSDIMASNIDIYGYGMMVEQFLVLDKPTQPTNITITLYANKLHLPSSEFNISFNVQLGYSDVKPCPRSCSGNGICGVDGLCKCNGNFKGYDCSINPIIYTSEAKIIDRQLQFGNSEYIYFQKAQLSNLVNYIYTIEVQLGQVAWGFGLENTTNLNLLPFVIFNHNPMVNTYEYFSIPKDSQTNQWLIFTPVFRQRTVYSGWFVINYAYAAGDNAFTVFFILMVIGIFFTFLCLTNRMPPPHHHHHTHARISDRISVQEVQKYFPDIKYTNLYPKKLVEGETNHECVICLCNMEDQQKVKLTYCNHVFHSNCLVSWFKVEQTCPYCRAIFSKPKTMEYYAQVNTYFKTLNSNKDLPLSSEDIPHYVKKLYLSKKQIEEEPPVSLKQAIELPKQPELREESDHRLSVKLNKDS